METETFSDLGHVGVACGCGAKLYRRFNRYRDAASYAFHMYIYTSSVLAFMIIKARLYQKYFGTSHLRKLPFNCISFLRPITTNSLLLSAGGYQLTINSRWQVSVWEQEPQILRELHGMSAVIYPPIPIVAMLEETHCDRSVVT